MGLVRLIDLFFLRWIRCRYSTSTPRRSLLPLIFFFTAIVHRRLVAHVEKRKVETIPSHTISSLWRCYDAVVLDNLEDLEKKIQHLDSSVLCKGSQIIHTILYFTVQIMNKTIFLYIQNTYRTYSFHSTM